MMTNSRRRTARILAMAATLALPMLGCADEPEPGAGSDEGSTSEDGSTSVVSTSGETDAATTGTTDVEPSTGAAETSVADAPTWHQDIAPIVVGRCAGCHREGGIAPFSFEAYDGAAPLAEAIVASVGAGAMPPWGADETEECTPPLGFKDDLRISDADLDLLTAWADAGAPEGDAASAAELPTPPSLELEAVDQRLTMANPVTIDGATDQFMCFSLDPELTEDQFLKAIQIVPDNDKIVHHVLIYIDEDGVTAGQGEEGVYPCSGGALDGDLIGAWAPGALPNRNPPDTGMLVPAGARLVMNIHYHPTGLGPEVDAETTLELDWHDERPAWASQLTLIGNFEGGPLQPGPGDRGGPEFRIPAGAENHTEEMLFTVPDSIPEVRLWEVGTHMHYVGVDMIMGVRRGGGSETECLLQTPRYDFEWQRQYVYDGTLDEVPRVRAGDEIYLRCNYNNSLSNAHVADALAEQGLDAPVDVFLGEETLDEMCLGVFGIAFPNVL